MTDSWLAAFFLPRASGLSGWQGVLLLPLCLRALDARLTRGHPHCSQLLLLSSSLSLTLCPHQKLLTNKPMAELQRTLRTETASPTGLDLLLSAVESVEGSVSPELRSDSDYLFSPPSTQRALFATATPSDSSDALVTDATPTCGLLLHRQTELEDVISLFPVKTNPKKRSQIARSCARCRTVGLLKLEIPVKLD